MLMDAGLGCAAKELNLNVYATAHLSGDVANAVTLLKRMTRPASRKHKAGLLVPSAELAACQVRTPTLYAQPSLVGVSLRVERALCRSGSGCMVTASHQLAALRGA